MAAKMRFVDWKKITGHSAVLGRSWHADLIVAGDPTVLVVMFGGSGMTKEKYTARASSHPHHLEPALPASDLAFAYVSFPYDIDVDGFSPEQEEQWLDHAEDELLPALLAAAGLSRWYLVGYSGGLALALSGLHLAEECAGVAGIGGDKVPERLEVEAPTVDLFYNIGDRVFGVNEVAVRALVAAGSAQLHPPRLGGHDMSDYVANGTLAKVATRAVAVSGP